MLVSDLALREDPIYSAIALSWVNDFQALTNAFAAAWCKSPLVLALPSLSLPPNFLPIHGF